VEATQHRTIATITTATAAANWLRSM
jgi:hypothetical protein